MTVKEIADVAAKLSDELGKSRALDTMNPFEAEAWIIKQANERGVKDKEAKVVAMVAMNLVISRYAAASLPAEDKSFFV